MNAARRDAMVGARVLVADDDDEMRHMVANALRRDGCEVEEIATGGYLLVAVTTRIMHAAVPSVDLLVTDVRMPGCSGLDVVEMLRARSLRLPVVVMTAFGDDETKERARRAGAFVLDKPFGLDELKAAVGVLLRFRKAPAAL